MKIYYLVNKTKQATQSAETGTYSSLYQEEMMSHIGVGATPYDLEHLRNCSFKENDVVFVGADELTAEQASVLKRAADKGTLVVGFATRGAEDLFGITVKSVLRQQDLYETIGYFSAAKEILPSKNAKEPLPFSRY